MVGGLLIPQSDSLVNGEAVSIFGDLSIPFNFYTMKRM